MNRRRRVGACGSHQSDENLHALNALNALNVFSTYMLSMEQQRALGKMQMYYSADAIASI